MNASALFIEVETYDYGNCTVTLNCREIVSIQRGKGTGAVVVYMSNGSSYSLRCTYDDFVEELKQQPAGTVRVLSLPTERSLKGNRK